MASWAGSRRVQSWPFSGEAAGSPCMSPQSPQITFCPGLSDWHFSSLCDSCLWGMRGPVSSGATAGDWEALPCPSSAEPPKCLVANLENLEVEPQIYHLETLARLLDTGLTGGWGVRQVRAL